MSLADHYRVLGLRSGSAFEEVKAAYRRLARRYHPDVNPGDQQAKDKFIQVTQAYQTLADAIAPEAAPSLPPQPSKATGASVPAPEGENPSQALPKVQVNPQLSEADQALKQRFYEQLQELLRAGRLPRAIALAEALAQRFPQDLEVRQWQAIIYQRWGRYLIGAQEWDKAERFLQKALRTDPHNRSLWREVGQDMQQLQRAKQVPFP